MAATDSAMVQGSVSYPDLPSWRFLDLAQCLVNANPRLALLCDDHIKFVNINVINTRILYNINMDLSYQGKFTAYSMDNYFLEH